MYDLQLISLFKATWETIYMVFIASFLSVFIGLIVGTLLFTTGKRQVLENAFIHRILSAIVNITRSLPFIILMILLIPLTRLIIGTTIGTNAALVPLAIAAIPFYARICENALAEVPFGLIEAGNAMGASSWQIVTRILIPESLPALIRGGTLLVIGLIGYSAMAGVVGGGGLGELAINYGYQRFDVLIMLETVLVLIFIVQFVQVTGDYLAKHRALKLIGIASVIFWTACLAYQFWPTNVLAGNSLRVGIISGTSEKVMQIAAEVAQKQYGIQLQIVPFTDYVEPNTALSNKSIDANIFQHAPYLDGQIQARHYQLTSIAKTFVYPMGFYSQKITNLAQLKDNAVVAIPNDPSNGGRSLLLLQKVGLIQLKAGVGVYGKIADIIANPHHLQFKLLDAAELPRVLKDADLVAITNDFLAPTGLTLQNAVIKEGSDSPYANLIVVRSEDKNKALLQKIILIMHSKAVIAETEKDYPNGAAIPAWGI